MVDEKVSEFHRFDPWDYLNNLYETLNAQQKHISTIIQAHNINQAQVNDLMARVVEQRNQIVSLQAQINSLALNIKQKDSPNG